MMFSDFEGRGLRTRMRGKIQGHKYERMRRAAVAETHLSVGQISPEIRFTRHT